MILEPGNNQTFLSLMHYTHEMKEGGQIFPMTAHFDRVDTINCVYEKHIKHHVT